MRSLTWKSFKRSTINNTLLWCLTLSAMHDKGWLPVVCLFISIIFRGVVVVFVNDF